MKRGVVSHELQTGDSDCTNQATRSRPFLMELLCLCWHMRHLGYRVPYKQKLAALIMMMVTIMAMRIDDHQQRLASIVGWRARNSTRVLSSRFFFCHVLSSMLAAAPILLPRPSAKWFALDGPSSNRPDQISETLKLDRRELWWVIKLSDEDVPEWRIEPRTSESCSFVRVPLSDEHHHQNVLN